MSDQLVPIFARASQCETEITAMFTCLFDEDNVEACMGGDDDEDDDDDDGYSFSFSYSFSYSYGDDDDDDGDDDYDPCSDCSGAKSNLGAVCADQTAGTCSECLSESYAFYECIYQAMWDASCPNDACDASGACAGAISSGTRNGVVFALALTLLAPFALRF